MSQTLQGTLRAYLETTEIPTVPLYDCPACGHPYPPECIKDVSDRVAEFGTEFVCADCFLTHEREIWMAAERAIDQDTWSGERGADVRHERNLRLTVSDALAPADRPMSDERRAAVLAYRQALRDVTTTFARPSLVVWPTQP